MISKIYNANIFYRLRKTVPRALSYYNSDNTNNCETAANNTSNHGTVLPTVKAELPTVKAYQPTVNNAVKAELTKEIQRIEDKIDWIIIFSFPTWIYTMAMSIHKLLH